MGRASLGFQLVCRSLKVNETITYARMLWGDREGIIANALGPALPCGLFLSDSAYQSQVCGRNGPLRVCARVHVGMHMRVCVTMLMRTIIFLHLEPISRDYDDGLS